MLFKERQRRNAFKYMNMFINIKYMQTKILNIYFTKKNEDAVISDSHDVV